MNIHGMKILVTGASSGIGAALAERFAGQGARLVLTARRGDRLEELAAALPGAAAIAADIATAEGIAGLVQRTLTEHPDLDGILHNAGIMQAEDLRHGDAAIAEATVATNLLAPMRLTAALLPGLLNRPRAAIMTVTSGLAFVPLAMTPAYSATKAALHSWTQSLRHQLRDTAVRVIEIAPPAVQTDLMPGHAQNPNAQPLDSFADEVMSLLAQDPAPDEILVERVLPLRRAEAEGTHATLFAAINGARR